MDPNPVYRFVTGPFVRRLAKLAVYIFVGWNALLVSVVGGTVAMIVVLAAVFGSGAPLPSDKLGDLETVAGAEFSTNQLLSIPVTGTIIGEANGPLSAFSDATDGYEVKDRLMAAAKRSDIRGVLLKINSPGGTIYGAHAISDGVEYYRRVAKRPVVAYVQGVGASGAYWVAAAADHIIADYGTDVGSIGVIMGPFKYYNTPVSEDGGLFAGGVITQKGIESVNITAGRSKDIGDPYRRLTADEQRQLQQSVNNEYDQFVSYVATRRGLTADVVKNQVGAMIYDTTSAKALKLIDEVGNRDDAYAALAKAAKLGHDYRVVQPLAPIGFLGSLLGMAGYHVAPARAKLDACVLTRTTLAYHGSVANLCQ
jgi:protease IV